MMDENSNISDQSGAPSWPQLISQVIGAALHHMVRVIRGQQHDERTQPDWRVEQGVTSANEPSPHAHREDTVVSNGLRGILQRFIAREKATSHPETVHYSRRRIAWDTMAERELFSRIWVYFRPFRGQIAILLSHIVIAVAIGVAAPWITKVILDAGVLVGDTRVVLLCAGTLAAIYFFGSLNMRAYSRRTYAMSHRVIHNFRKDCSQSIERLHPLQFTDVEPQQVATLTQENAAAVLQILSSSVLRTIVGVAVALVLLVVLFFIDWRIAALGVAALPINIFLQIRYRWQFRRTWHRVNEYYYHIKDLVSERVEHHEVYRAFGIHERAARNTEKFIGQNRNASVARDWINADWNFYVEVTGHICHTAIMALTGWMAARSEITPGMFMMLIVISTQLYRPILDAYGVLMHVQGALSRVSDTIEFIDREKEPKHEPLPPAKHPKRLRGEIDIVDVSFRYLPQVEVLQKVNMHIRPGDHVGLIGRTGSGKTTLFRLIAREYEPSEGAIFFDGYDYRDLDVNWFRNTQLAVVLQDPHIINSRVGHNIRLARPDATVDEVIEAAKMAEAHDFIARLPDGYNTLVGPHGIRLSGGERQRIAIARAALRNPRILILDESTSSLDNVTEARIQQALERLMQDRTTLAISHRWTTLKSCAPIYCVLDNGQTTNVGSYEDLLSQAEVHGDQLYSHLSQTHAVPAVSP